MKWIKINNIHDIPSNEPYLFAYESYWCEGIRHGDYLYSPDCEDRLDQPSHYSEVNLPGEEDV